MNTQDIFEEDWRACLRAHYFHVIKERDENNETSLRTVLIQTGFTEDDIDAMRGEVLAELGWLPDNQPADQAADQAADQLADQSVLTAQATEQPVESEDTVTTGEVLAADEAVAPTEVAPIETVELESAAPEISAPPDSDQHEDPPEPLVQMSLF